VRGRYTASAGASYVFKKNTRFCVDFLYGYGLKKGFASTEKLPGYNPLNLGVEHVFHAKFGAIRELNCASIASTSLTRSIDFATAPALASPLRSTAPAATF
jgi:hypothetical protein